MGKSKARISIKRNETKENEMKIMVCGCLCIMPKILFKEYIHTSYVHREKEHFFTFFFIFFSPSFKENFYMYNINIIMICYWRTTSI